MVGRCVSISRPDAGNACLTSDMCYDDDPFNDDLTVASCFFDGGSPGSLGVCLPTHGQCTEPGSPPDQGGPKPCCSGLAKGTDNKCCIQDGLYCNENQSGTCCAGSKCQANKCVPATTPDPDLYSHCLYFQSCGGTSGSYWCDPISETCGKTFCFGASLPAGNGKTGCCKWGADKFGSCTFPDNSSCLLFGAPCQQNNPSQCCSNSCVQFSDMNYYCEYPAYYP